jgi:PAS domain S-box-containing protein
MDGTSSQGAEAEVPASARLQASKERILKLWMSRVRQDIPAARAQDEPQLRNSLPQFLDRLVAALAAEPRWRVSLEALNDVSREHGKQRSSLEEYSLHQMLQEYQLLREVIFHVLEQKAPVTTAERDLVLTAIEQAMAEAGACFAQFAQSRERSAEERYRLIIENVKDHAIIRTSPDGRIFDWNSGAENIFQYREDEVRGKDCRLLFTPEDLAQGAAEQEMKTALATGKAEDKRWHVKKDGSRFFANGVMNPLRDATGRVLGFVKVLRDDTERATAEAKLQQSRALLEAVIRHVPVGISITDAKTGKALYHNEEIDRLTERRVSEHQGLQQYAPYGAVHPDGSPYQPEDHPTARAIRKGEVTRSEEMRYRRTDGTLSTLLVSSSPIRDQDGNIQAAVTAVHDLTERKQLEERLRMLKHLTEQSSDFIGVATPDGRALFVNEAGRKMVGLGDLEEALKTQVLDYFLEEDKPFVREVILPTQEREGRWAGEFRFRNFKTGEAIPVHYNQFVIRDEKGSISGVATVTRDLRGEKQAEQRFRQIANALPQIIWTATPDFVVDWYNDWWFKYLGLPRGTRWDDPDTLPMHPEDVEQTRPRLKEAVETGKDFLMEQRFRRGSDGQYRWHLVRGVPLRDSDGRIVKWIGANTDIHDQKVFTARLEEERELRERFVATLSHDLRTPLTAAKLNAHMVARKAGDPTVLYKLAARISENLDRADQMISDMLDANRIRAGEPLPIEVSKCELSALVQGTLEELSLLHGHRFVLDAPELLQGYWSCSGIRRIIENLCNNAIKYGARDRPVTVRLAQSGQDEVSISVHNWGSPIAPEEQKALFQLYRRAGSAQVRAQKGWGLGLTLVEGLAKAHRGSVRVESTEEAGTTFTVSLARDMRQ